MSAICPSFNMLTHFPLISIGSDNGLLPILCEAIIYTNAGLL